MLTSRIAQQAFRSIALAALVGLAAAPAQAQHRARLSADLADHLARGAQNVDVIVHGDQAEVDAIAARYNVVVKRYLRSGAVLRVNAGQLAALQQDEAVDHLSGDVVIRSAADVTAESIGADQVWRGEGDLPPLSGAGVTVAVIDTGMDLQHHALRGRVLLTRDFTGGDGIDRFGHGTHVAAIIAGAAGQTADTRGYQGIAPGAALINLRALGDDGSGTVSNVIEAIDWAIDHRREFRIRVINLSLGAPVLQPYRDDPLCEAVERAVTAGIVVVAAAGNHGITADGRTVLGSITSPGNSPHALTVGAIDTHNTPQRSDDTVAAYSSRGPTRYDLIVKPDLVAPGSHIVSAEASGSYLSTTYPERHVGGSGANAYMQLSGTSMAAGVVSGSLALILQHRPSLVPQRAKVALELTSSFASDGGVLGGGAGSLNVLAAAELVQRGRFGLHETATVIGGEPVHSDGVVTTPNVETIVWGKTIIWGKALVSGQTIVWGQTIIWGQSLDTIIWGQLASQSLNTIIWGQNLVGTIVWGQSSLDTIIWGQGGQVDTIIWGQSVLD